MYSTAELRRDTLRYSTRGVEVSEPHTVYRHTHVQYLDKQLPLLLATFGIGIDRYIVSCTVIMSSSSGSLSNASGQQNKRLSVNARKSANNDITHVKEKEVWSTYTVLSFLLYYMGVFDLPQSSTNSADTINVVCRFRPVKPNEAPNNRQVFQIDPTSKSVEIFIDAHDQKTFAFDKVMHC